MRWQRLSAVMICTALTLCLTSAFAQTSTTTKPTSRPATSRPTKPADPLKGPISELVREAETALKQKIPFPRAEANYFVGNVLSQEELLKQLGRPLSRDPRADAYVKWQLLSGVEAFDEARTAAVLKVYIAAPPFVPTPISQRDLGPWENKKATAKKGDEEKINEDYAAYRKTFEDQNIPILNYRDALRSKIHPPAELKPKVFAAELEDLNQRAEAGLDVYKDFKALATEIATWAVLAKKSEIAQMQAAVGEYQKRSPQKIIDKLVMGSTSLYWRKRELGLTAKTLDALDESLKQAYANAL